MLKPEQARDHLVQALLAAPMFQIRWRWNATRALAVLRQRGGKKTPPPLQRFRADDLLTAVFPLQTACFEHRPPDIPVPDHPLVNQTVHDCLTEAMDVERWEKLLADVEQGRIKLVGKDTREPSPFSYSILNANPYAFLDDAPLEERRARAVASRRTLSADDMRDLARLDPEAIERVRAEAWPLVRDPEELHDALLSLTALPAAEGSPWKRFFEELSGQGRATEARRPSGPALWTAAERWMAVKALFPDAKAVPELTLPAELSQPVEAQEAAVALIRGRLEAVGPVTAAKLASDLGLQPSTIETALAALEAEGFAMQGRFTEPAGGVEWCERRLLARIHRLTLDGARKRVQAVPPDVYWRFLGEYHHLLPDSHRDGRLGLYEAIGQLQGFEAAVGAWEADLLPGRVEKYQPEWLDTLSFSGELIWARLRPPGRAEEAPKGGQITRVVPISLAFRTDLAWLLAPSQRDRAATSLAAARAEARTVYEALKAQGALFLHDVAEVTGLPTSRVEDALSELAALGLVTADGFAAIRSLVPDRAAKARARSRWRRPRPAAYGRGGRWTLFPGRVGTMKDDERLQSWAWQLLRRYGVVFRDLLEREAASPSWWELAPVFRRLEAKGEVRGGRFVSGVGGEQYALAEAVEALRRNRDGEDDWFVVSAVDPLNLTGVLTPGQRVTAVRGNRLLIRNGRVQAALQAGEVVFYEDAGPAKDKLARALKLQVVEPREGLLKELALIATAR
jgi:ATP-dependent helicase Lhr and Lhr-like helicase